MYMKYVSRITHTIHAWFCVIVLNSTKIHILTEAWRCACFMGPSKLLSNWRQFLHLLSDNDLGISAAKLTFHCPIYHCHFFMGVATWHPDGQSSLSLYLAMYDQPKTVKICQPPLVLTRLWAVTVPLYLPLRMPHLVLTQKTKFSGPLS